MVTTVCCQYTMLPVRRSCQASSIEILGHLLRGPSMTVDGLPCSCGGVGELVGSYAYNRPVLVMQLHQKAHGAPSDRLTY